MIKQFYISSKYPALYIIILLVFVSCKHKKKMQKTENSVVISNLDTLNNKCRLDYKSSKTPSRHVKENEFKFDWVYAKANVESMVDEKEESFDIKVRMRRDSAMLITIQYLLGLEVAKI